MILRMQYTITSNDSSMCIQITFKNITDNDRKMLENDVNFDIN